MKFMSSLPVLIAVLACTFSAEVGFRSYAGYKVLRASCSNPEQFSALETFSNEIDTDGIDFWTEPAQHGDTDILVAPQELRKLEEFLIEHGIQYNVHIEDIEKIISEQRVQMLNHHKNQPRMNWDEYQNIATIYTWLQSLVQDYPDLVSIINIGKSTENRDLFVLKISQAAGGNETRPAFWIDATIHAREWVSTSTITYIINELTSKSGSEQYQQYLSSIDFYFLPIINPDGYSFTFTNDRLWRKTLSNHDSPTGCRGVDANRNFGYQFGGPGSSNDTCSQTYRGPSAYSEPETEAMKNFIVEAAANGVKWEAYITLHSYSQLWMTPWGYSKELPADYTELKRVGDLAVEELRSHYGTIYEVGSAANILYESSGSSRDWAKGEGGFKYVYTLELRDTGRYGFVLPADQIFPTAKETWDGIQVVVQAILPTKESD